MFSGDDPPEPEEATLAAGKKHGLNKPSLLISPENGQKPANIRQSAENQTGSKIIFQNYVGINKTDFYLQGRN